MNENVDLMKILKNCPKGWKFYSSVYGEVEFETIKFYHLNCRFDTNVPIYSQPMFEEDLEPIKFTAQSIEYCVSSAGEHKKGFGECTFFPSKDQRDWSKFTAPWYKKEKFDPKTLNPFDKVIVRDNYNDWVCTFFSHIKEFESYPYRTSSGRYAHCIPYNDDTKHLVGTKEKAPEYYRYWE